MCCISFDDWFFRRTGRPLSHFKMAALGPGGTDRTAAAYKLMEERYRSMYESEQAARQSFLEKPDFNTWLHLRSGHTCGELYELARKTGNYQDYEKLISWYKNRYQLEQENPFLMDADAETSGNGEKNEHDRNFK